MPPRALSTNLYYKHLDDYLRSHQNVLSSLKPRVDHRIKNEEAFDAECVRLFGVHSSNSTAVSTDKPLEPCLKKIQSLVAALNLTGCNADHKIAIWTIVVIVLEIGSVEKDKRTQVIHEISDYADLIPDFDLVPAAVYNSFDATLRLNLADLFGDTLNYFAELLKMVISPSSTKLSIRNFKYTSKAASLKDAKTAIKAHTEDFNEQALVIGEQLRGSASGGSTSASASASASGGSDGGPSESEHIPKPTATRRTKQRLRTRYTVGVPVRNREFFGREDALRKIHSFLVPTSIGSDASTSSLEETEPLTCVIHGTGGVGKTQTAAQYAWKHTDDYKWLFWVRAETETQLMNSYMRIGRKLGMFESTEKPGTGAMEKVQEGLEECQERWLLIFDNVDVWDGKTESEDGPLENWDDISRFWPRSTVSGSSIIVTTQKPAEELGHWSKNNVQLKPFDDDLGAEFIIQRSRLDGSNSVSRVDVARKITKHIGGLPLYLNQAAGFMRRTQSSLDQYLEELKGHILLPQISGPDFGLGYDKPLNAAFAAAINRLTKDAKKLLYIIAFLNPEWIPESMLFSDHHDGPRSFLREDYKIELIAQLRDGQLVDRGSIGGEQCLFTHRSVQLGIRLRLEGNLEERRSAFDNAAHVLSSVLPQVGPLQQPDEKAWAAIEKYLPHLQTLETCYEELFADELDTLKLARLFSQYGMDFWDKGLIKVGEKLTKTAELILSKNHETSAIEMRANILIILGMYTDSLGITRREDGLAYRNEAYKLRQEVADAKGRDKMSRDDDVLLHNAVMDLSCSYQHFNRFDKVEELSEACFRAYERWGSPRECPFEYAKFFHSMTFVFVHRRETALAVRYAKAGSDLMHIAGGGTFLTTAYRFDYAIALYQDGKVDEAITEHEEILDLRIKRCGKAHSATVGSYLVLGIICYLQRNWEAAENWFRRVLTYYTRANWTEASLARVKYYMSQTLRARPGIRRQLSTASNSSLTLAYCSKAKQPQELETMPRSELADLLFKEAETVLQDVLPPNERGKLLGKEKPVNDTDRALLYDYLAPWTHRLVVQQIPDYAKRLAVVESVTSVEPDA